MKERKFITESVKKLLVSEYIRKETESAGFGSMVMKRTPFGTNITLHVNKPGLVIGRRGSKIQEITENLEKLYSVESPQIEVKEAENPDLNPQVVSKKIALSLEKGWSYRKAGNTSLRRAVDSDVRGIMIKVSGKLTGERSRTQKFFHGSVKYSGEPGRAAMLNGFSIAKMKQGVIGITVRILDPDYRLPDEISYALDGTRKITKPQAEGAEAEAVVEPAVEIKPEATTETAKPEPVKEKVKLEKPAVKSVPEKVPEKIEAEPSAEKKTEEKKEPAKEEPVKKEPVKKATRKKAAEKKEEKEPEKPKKAAAKKTTRKKAAEKKADEPEAEKKEEEKPEKKKSSAKGRKTKEPVKEEEKKAAPKARGRKSKKETEDTTTEASKESDVKTEETDGADGKKD